MKDYKIVVRPTPIELEKDVKMYMLEVGYRPQGGVCVVKHATGNMYYQAMILDDDEAR